MIEAFGCFFFTQAHHFDRVRRIGATMTEAEVIARREQARKESERLWHDEIGKMSRVAMEAMLLTVRYPDDERLALLAEVVKAHEEARSKYTEYMRNEFKEAHMLAWPEVSRDH